MKETEEYNTREKDIRDRTLRFFTYLKELCALRITPARNVSSYDQVFWFCDLPRNKLCRSALWQIIDPPPFSTENHADTWIEIHKPSLKSPPEPPDDVEPWIKDEELNDSSHSKPRYYEQLPRSALQEKINDEDPNVLVSINEYPQVFDKYLDYIESQWKPWAEEDRELQKVQKAYNQLFNIYQRQERFGEQYEVIIGAGFLSWKSPNSGEIERHVLEIQTRIKFDRVCGIISAGPEFDNSLPILEYGMLETIDRPSPKDLTEIEKAVCALDSNPWDSTNLKSVLCAFANSLPITGDYSSSFEHSGTLSNDRPTVKFAPALILRKRTRRTFKDFYQQIIEQIEKGGDIPENILRIVDIIEDSQSENNLDCNADTKRKQPQIPIDTELYFPLPANNEQKRIAQKIAHRRGVLVQGPPGTGKSHTIANLISHFLAQGKRILVTSQTPRALEVLRDKLPQELKELCVVWLGSGPESHNALRKSVEGITQKKANWNLEQEQSLIEKNIRSLDIVRKEQAQLRHELRMYRDVNVYCHSNILGRYSGTLQHIAEQINQERNFFNWFVDQPQETTEPPVSSDELLKMVQIQRSLTPELTEQLKLRLFPIEPLTEPDDFSHYIEAEQRAHATYKETHDKRNYPGYAHLSDLDREKRDAVKVMIDSIFVTQDVLSRHFHSWAGRMAREIAGDHDRVWRHILSATLEHIEHIEALLAEHGKLVVVGLSGKEYQLVLGHIRALITHIQGGGKLGFWIFQAQAVKNARYIIQSVTVNGKLCRDIQTLNQVTAWININSRIEALNDLWKELIAPPTGDVLLQCSAYRDFCEPIKQALALYEQIQQVRETCREYPSIRLPAWHSQDEIKAFGKAIDAMNLEEDFATVQYFFIHLEDLLKTHISSGHSHATTEQLLEAVASRDGGFYHIAFDTLSSMHTFASNYNLFQSIHQRFYTYAPQTCKNYDASYTESIWNERFSSFDSALIWVKVNLWIDKKNDKKQFKHIQNELNNSVKREYDILKNLVALKAWQNCMIKLCEKERMALVAWTQAVTKIRSGTGKYAETHRETARQKLDECRNAIPAWVMPLYQVVQTIRPKRHQFDVVIIDEASQSGPEALLLNYISDKLIVVGDDKQITPMHVGIDRSTVDFLQRKYLKDIPHKETLDLESSLFSQAELRFPDRIRLREHFRCMPEIIQFSNNISYATDPLIPLRQYGEERLNPLQTIFVKDGYRKGASEDIENPPEAEAIVAQIAECCENPSYKNKTFGVICLLGRGKQAELIERLLVKEIGAEEIEKRRIICGLPSDFQGDERNVIFLSMVDAQQDGHPCRMIRDENTQRRFNVAASRAKDQMWLFHSVTLNDLRPECLRYKLLEYCQNPNVFQPEEIGDISLIELRRMASDPFVRKSTKRGEKIPGTQFDSWFEVDVFFKIIDRGYRVLPQYPVNTKRIDLVVEGLCGRLAVECDGDYDHGIEQWEEDQIRQRELERCGWTFWRIQGFDFYRNPDGSLVELWETLNRLKITPHHTWVSDSKKLKTELTAIECVPQFVSNGKHQEHIDTEAEEDQQNTPILTDTNERLNHALEYARSKKTRLEDLPPLNIQNAIVQVLQKCPNYTCTLKSLTSRVLTELEVSTRGNPRLEFEKRVIRNLSVLKRKGWVEEYKAKNKRIRFLREQEYLNDTLFTYNLPQLIN